MQPPLPRMECEKFHAYYESNGWMVGRNKMKSWKAAMVHWRSNCRPTTSNYRPPYKTMVQQAIEHLEKPLDLSKIEALQKQIEDET